MWILNQSKCGKLSLEHEQQNGKVNCIEENGKEGEGKKRESEIEGEKVGEERDRGRESGRRER